MWGVSCVIRCCTWAICCKKSLSIVLQAASDEPLLILLARAYQNALVFSSVLKMFSMHQIRLGAVSFTKHLTSSITIHFFYTFTHLSAFWYWQLNISLVMVKYMHPIRHDRGHFHLFVKSPLNQSNPLSCCNDLRG